MAKELLARFEEVPDYKAIISAGKPFTDDAFPANQSSMGDIEGDYKWKRASEIFHGKQVVYDTFSINDIEQGELGDCYFLSAIAALAEFPGRVQKLMKVNEPNSAGCYAVHLYVCGAKVTVVMDDFLPVSPKGSLVFAGSKGNELWVILLEKAWGKIHKKFSLTEGGDSRESLGALTGAPAEYIKHGDYAPEDLWKKLKDFDDKNYIMNTGAREDNRGVVKGHAYTLIKAVEETIAGKKERLVQIRNPWGDTEWKGDWNDKDPRWTKELNKRMDHTDEDDGTFFMSFSDFRTVFFHTFVAKVHDDYIYSNTYVENSLAVAAFHVTRHLKGFLSAYQVTGRLGKSVLGEYKVERQRLQLFKLNGDEQVEISQAWNDAVGVATIEVDLEDGDYVMKAAFSSKATFPFIGLVAYTDKAVDLMELDIKSESEITAEKIREVMKSVKDTYAPQVSCESIAGRFETCSQGHQLVWSTELSETGKTYKCENCRKSQDVSIGRWLCKQCLYDICQDCRPKEIGKVVVSGETATVSCINGHPMKFGNGANPHQLYLCNKCGKAYFGKVPRWICSECNIDFCYKCFEAPKGQEVKEPIQEIDHCPRGHKFVFSNSMTCHSRFECDICTSLGDPESGRWECSLCNFNICTKCKPCSGVVNTSIAPKTKTLVCNNGHLLSFTCAHKEGECFICDKCEGNIEKDYWRWNCKICDFDVCEHCRPAPEGRKDVMCNNFHMLCYSISEVMGMTYGRCDKCSRAFNLAQGRYCCAVCNYELCSKCCPAESGVQERAQKKKEVSRPRENCCECLIL